MADMGKKEQIPPKMEGMTLTGYDWMSPFPLNVSPLRGQETGNDFVLFSYIVWTRKEHDICALGCNTGRSECVAP